MKGDQVEGAKGKSPDDKNPSEAQSDATNSILPLRDKVHHAFYHSQSFSPSPVPEKYNEKEKM